MTVLPDLFFLAFSVNLLLKFNRIFKAHPLRYFVLRNKIPGLFTNRSSFVKHGCDFWRPQPFFVDPKARRTPRTWGSKDK